MNPDAALFHLLNGLAGRWPLFDLLVRAVVNDYAVPTLFALIVGSLWFAGATDSARRRSQLGVLYALVGELLANLVVKANWELYYRLRPFAVEENVTLLFYRPAVSSMPSVPVAALTALAVGVYLFNRRIGAIMLLITALFALSRVIAGVHYPSDVLVGAGIAAACTYLPYRFAPRLLRVLDGVRERVKRVSLA